MTEMEKLCVLTFDKMSIKTALRYDTVNDQFVDKKIIVMAAEARAWQTNHLWS